MQGVKIGSNENVTSYSLLPPPGSPEEVKSSNPPVSVGQPAQRTPAYHGKKSSSFTCPLVELDPKAHSAIFSIYGVPRMGIGKEPHGPAPKDLPDPSSSVTL
jgi:hypothetical protein